MTHIRALERVAPDHVTAYGQGMAGRTRPGRVGVIAEPIRSVALMLEECTAGYGADLLAYLLGAGAGVPLAGWRLDASRRSPDRLRTSYRVLGTFPEARLARTWMRACSPRFGGRTPAWAVRSGDRYLLALVEREAVRAQ
jgi:hypothetical protein